MNVLVEDDMDSIWVTAYDDTAETIMKFKQHTMSADELVTLNEDDKKRFCEKVINKELKMTLIARKE